MQIVQRHHTRDACEIRTDMVQVQMNGRRFEEDPACAANQRESTGEDEKADEERDGWIRVESRGRGKAPDD